jgi:hypothetical protein
MNLLTTSAVLLAAVLPRIFAVVVNPNPFTEEVANVQLGQDFTIHWQPTTPGTVTITIYGMDENDNVSSDVYVLGGMLLRFSSHDSHNSNNRQANSRD